LYSKPYCIISQDSSIHKDQNPNALLHPQDAPYLPSLNLSNVHAPLDLTQLQTLPLKEQTNYGCSK